MTEDLAGYVEEIERVYAEELAKTKADAEKAKSALDAASRAMEEMAKALEKSKAEVEDMNVTLDATKTVMEEMEKAHACELEEMQMAADNVGKQLEQAKKDLAETEQRLAEHTRVSERQVGERSRSQLLLK